MAKSGAPLPSRVLKNSVRPCESPTVEFSVSVPAAPVPLYGIWECDRGQVKTPGLSCSRRVVCAVARPRLHIWTHASYAAGSRQNSLQRKGLGEH